MQNCFRGFVHELHVAFIVSQVADGHQTCGDVTAHKNKIASVVNLENTDAQKYVVYPDYHPQGSTSLIVDRIMSHVN